MPHILLESHNDIDVNICNNKNDLKSVFNFVAISDYDKKIGVTLEGKEFLLTKVNKKGDDLVKLDNATRLTPVSLMKTALNDYSKISGAKELFSNTNSIYNKIEPEESYLKNIKYFADDFKTDKEIWVEVGFGSGKHMLHQAQKNPDKLLIGLEIHTPSIEQVLKQVKLQNITNVLAVNYDARLFLEFLRSNSTGKIFVHFPVPWDKKPHRRVMSIGFIEEALRVLKIGGTLELRTDSPNYYEYSKGLFDHFKEYPSLIRENEELGVVSKYEARWKKQEKTIWDITITSTKDSPQSTIEGNFTFPSKFNIDKIKENIPKKAILKDEYLVHFETIYDLELNGAEALLMKLTMGSFNRPVTKYILIETNGARYFQGEPIKTKTNLSAHKTVIESLT